jgi:hypothetical protein
MNDSLSLVSDTEDEKKRLEPTVPLNQLNFLTQQIVEAGAAVRATWDLINNVVRHFFIVNALLLGFVGVIWNEHAKDAATAKESIAQNSARCKEIEKKISDPNLDTKSGIGLGVEKATLRCDQKSVGPVSTFVWPMAITLISIFAGFANAFALATLLRIGPGYGQGFLNKAKEAEEKALAAIASAAGTVGSLDYVGVYTAMHRNASKLATVGSYGFRGGIIRPAVWLFAIVIASWILTIFVVWWAWNRT